MWALGLDRGRGEVGRDKPRLRAWSVTLVDHCQEGRHFPLPFLVLLGGLRIKLTWDRLTGENKHKFNDMYIWDWPENWVTHQNGQNPHLEYHLQLKTEEDVGSSGLELQRWGKAIHMDMGKQMFAVPPRNNGTQGRILTDLARFLPVCTPASYYTIVMYGVSSLPGTSSYLHSFFFLLSWSRVDLQCCISFRCTAKWFSYTYLYIYFVRFFSLIGYYKILSIVACAIQ